MGKARRKRLSDPFRALPRRRRRRPPAPGTGRGRRRPQAEPSWCGREWRRHRGRSRTSGQDRTRLDGFFFFFFPFFKAQEVMCGGCGRCAALTARPGAAGGNVWGAREELVSSSPHLFITSSFPHRVRSPRHRGRRTGPRALVTPPGQTAALSRREQQQCEGGGSGFIFSFPNKLFCRAALLSCPAVGKA